jgi:hypothetical protein
MGIALLHAIVPATTGGSRTKQEVVPHPTAQKDECCSDGTQPQGTGSPYSTGIHTIGGLRYDSGGQGFHLPKNLPEGR